MAIKVGERVPDATLTPTEREGCTVGPNNFAVSDLVKGKRIAIFGLPGAFTPTCSAKHVPGFLQRTTSSRTRKSTRSGACRSTTRSSWARGAGPEGAKGKVRMLADGSGAYAKALGLEMDLTERGMGVRSQRYLDAGGRRRSEGAQCRGSRASSRSATPRRC